MNSGLKEIVGKYPLVAVVDDDESVRESLPDLLREFGFATHSFSSAEEFLTSDHLVQPDVSSSTSPCRADWI